MEKNSSDSAVVEKTIKTFGVASSYDSLLREIMRDIYKSYVEMRVWDMERAIRSLIALLPQDIKDRARKTFINRYVVVKESIRNHLNRSLMPNYYEYKEQLLEILMEVFEEITNLMDQAGLLQFKYTRQHEYKSQHVYEIKY